MVQTFNVPLSLKVGKRKPKNVWLNLSNYRNWQHHQNNQYKILFKEAIQNELQSLEKVKGIVSIGVGIYYPTKMRRDLDNTTSVITKFTLDALVEYGILEDDNIDIVRSIHGYFGGFDKYEPRGEITIMSGEDTKKWKEVIHI